MINNIIYLVITGILLVLIIVVQNRHANKNERTMGDSFVGKVPLTQIGNGYSGIYGMPPGVFPTGQPMMYPEQMYPKDPYYADTNENVGRPCNGPNGCGVFGSCTNGVCTVKDQHDTVFDIKV
jgi:hypothetical protein